MRRIEGVVAGSIRRWLGPRERPADHDAGLRNETAVFGPFRLDLRTGELWRQGQRVLAQRQPGLLLVLLVSRSGQLVTRDEIRSHLWAERHVESDAGMNYCIRQIRAALGEQASSPEYVETLRGRGYRFIGRVAGASGCSGPGVRHVPFRRLTRRRWASAAVTALLAVVTATWQRRPVAPPVSTIPVTLAIVPFQNLTDNESCAWIVRHIAQEVRAVLDRAHAAQVRVVSDPVRPLGTGDNLRSPAPTFLVTGAISSTGHGDQVTVQVLRSASGTVVRTYSFDSGVAFRRTPVIVDSLLPVLLAVNARAVSNR